LNFSFQTSGEFNNPYETNAKVAWFVNELSYSLDGNANVSMHGKTWAEIGGNTTLTGLSEGKHSIVVFAKRDFYYGLYLQNMMMQRYGNSSVMCDSFSSSTITFTVTLPPTAAPTPVLTSQESQNGYSLLFSQAWILAAVIIAAASAITIFFVLKNKSKSGVN
jgi:hypothetical protein